MSAELEVRLAGGPLNRGSISRRLEDNCVLLKHLLKRREQNDGCSIRF